MEIEKKKIGIDFDDVLIGFIASLTEYHNTTYHTSFTREDYTVWELHETWGTTEEEAETSKRIHNF